MRNQTLRNLLSIAIFGSASAAAFGQYDLSWYTIDGGGGMFSTAANYSLGGTIGQPDAGPAMSGGGYTLVGGFWQPFAAGTQCVPCDTNCDGSVNGFDIQPFIDLMIGATPCSRCAGDANNDGSLNGFDIQPFVECLGG